MAMVTVLPEGRVVGAVPGASLLESVSGVGIHVEAPCGGKGFCRKCRARVVSGLEGLTGVGDSVDGWILLCQAYPVESGGDITIEIPEGSRLSGQKILTDGLSRRTTLAPHVRKVYVTVPEADIREPRSDWDRMLDAVETSLGSGVDRRVDIRAARMLPGMVREGTSGVTVVLGGAGTPGVIGVEPGDTTALCYGVAFDIGTTTIVGYLIDLVTGEEVAVGSRMNPQVVFGDDVISRINMTMEDTDGLAKLQGKAVTALGDIVDELTGSRGIDASSVYDIVVAGNTSMGHLLAGIPPKHLGLYPYSAAVAGAIELSPCDIGYGRMNPVGRIRILPNVGSFVGADTVGVMLAVDAGSFSKPTLIIDIGTNGEIAMCRDGRIWTSSCAAGPAFEGGHLSCGMRATNGAIDKVAFGEPCMIRTLGDSPAKGICGSGLIDALAELIRYGVVDMTGRFTDPDDLGPDTPADVRRRIVKDDKGYIFVLATAVESATGEDVVINQKDVRELQLIKAAISAGCKILMDISGTALEELDSVLLAGAFGNFIDRDNALYIGLIPEVAATRVASIGNAAGAGARMALLSGDEWEKARGLAQRAVFVELANRNDFQDQYMDSMFFNNAPA